MTQQHIVRLDHCQTYYGWAGPLWNFAEDMAGWMAMTASGEVRFYGNYPFSSRDADWVVPLSEVTDLGTPPKYLGMSFGLNKALRARFGSRDRILSFSGLKEGLTKNDRMVGHTPVVGEAYLAAKLLVKEMPGSGDRAREAAEAWRALLGGGLRVDEMTVIGAIEA
jgi:hypothetical protein